MHSRNDAASTGAVSMLPQIDALPDSQQQLSGGQRHADAGAENRCFQMSRHIIGTLQNMAVIACIFRHRMVEMGFKVKTDACVGILVNGQRR